MGSFIQNEILGMAWLQRLIGSLLMLCGLDINSQIGGSVLFFLYDTIKIMLLLGFLILIISYIQSYFPPERSKKLLGRFNGMGARIIAALLGTVTPFCSCSSIPLFIGFTSAGLPLGVTFSFLISTPMVDLGSLMLLMSIFGWKVAVVYVVLGLVIAVAGGTLIEKLHLENQVQEYIRSAKALDIPQEELRFRDRIRYAWGEVLSTAKKVFPYVLVGVGIGAVIHNWIPEEWVITALGGNNPFGVIIATICGIPMYADIFGTIPIAEALLGKGALLGVVLSFMMGVTTLSLPSMIMLKKAVKAKLLGIFIAICAAGIIIVIACQFSIAKKKKRKQSPAAAEASLPYRSQRLFQGKLQASRCSARAARLAIRCTRTQSRRCRTRDSALRWSTSPIWRRSCSTV